MTSEKRNKIRTSVALDPEDYEWLQSVTGGLPFDSMGHAIRVAVKKLRSEYEERDEST